MARRIIKAAAGEYSAAVLSSGGHAIDDIIGNLLTLAAKVGAAVPQPSGDHATAL
jgi:hypothetical protein